MAKVCTASCKSTEVCEYVCSCECVQFFFLSFCTDIIQASKALLHLFIVYIEINLHKAHIYPMTDFQRENGCF